MPQLFTRSRPAAAAVVALFLVAAQGCKSPVERAAEAGRKEADQIARVMGIVDDPTLSEYVSQIGARLAQNAESPETEFQFLIVDTPDPNAFALPGGYVYVSRGLLALVNSEDQLAGVIGHEIGHITSNHAIKRIGVASPFALATGIAGFATAIVSPRLSQAVVGTTNAVTNGLFVAPFSRQQEREADDIGIELAAKSGWDPAALSRFLRILHQDVTLEAGEERRSYFLDSHPSTPERVEKTAKAATRVTQAGQPPIAADRTTMLGKLEGLIVGKDPVSGFFVGNRFLQPDMGFVIDFPNDWKTVNTPQAVIGAKPETNVRVGIQIAGRGDDPWEQIRDEQERRGKALPATEFLIGDLKAVRTLTEIRTAAGKRALDVTWVAYGGLVYGIYGVTDPGVIEGYEPTFRHMVMSFRPIEPAEVEAIEEFRLRVQEPREGERLSALVERTGSNWSVEKTAVANELDPEGALPSLPLKVSIPQSYTARR